MTVKLILMVIAALIFFVMEIPGAFAIHAQKEVTPYGDFCSRMSHYGMHKKVIDLKHAEEALKHYYGEKGLKVEVVSREGRFIKAHVKDNSSIVDTIIFDRRTGRLRSIY